MNMSERYDALLSKAYPLIKEIEELEYIQPRLLEIVDFYFNRYGFGTKIEKPKRYIKLEKEYDVIKKRLNYLKNKLFVIKLKINKIEKIKSCSKN